MRARLILIGINYVLKCVQTFFYFFYFFYIFIFLIFFYFCKVCVQFHAYNKVCVEQVSAQQKA